jgi:hypothetical protein
VVFHVNPLVKQLYPMVIPFNALTSGYHKVRFNPLVKHDVQHDTVEF